MQIKNKPLYSSLSGVQLRTETRRKLLMLAGPKHLFLTTGVFYLLEFVTKYEILLIVSEKYKTDATFINICQQLGISVEYQPELNIFSRNKYAAINLKKLVLLFKPDILFIHNNFYLDALYLIKWCKKYFKNCLRISYQDGKATFRWEDDFHARYTFDVIKIREKYKFLHVIFAGILKKTHYRLTFFVQMKLLPFLLTGKTLKPMIDIFSGRIFRYLSDENFSKKNDYQFVYFQSELDWYKSMGFQNLICIKHPVQVTGNVFYEKFVSKIDSVGILILPSYGLVDTLIYKQENKPNQILDQVAKLWIESIEIIMHKFPGLSIGVKLHPAAEKQEIWQIILEKLKKKINPLIIYPASINAEQLITQSSVIVGDVSTSLWWAALYRGKTIISLDIFGYDYGDEMKNFSEINYFTSVSQLGAANLKEKNNFSNDDKISATDFIESKLK